MKEACNKTCNEFIAAKCRGLGQRCRSNVIVKLDSNSCNVSLWKGLTNSLSDTVNTVLHCRLP